MEDKETLELIELKVQEVGGDEENLDPFKLNKVVKWLTDQGYSKVKAVELCLAARKRIIQRLGDIP